MKRESTTRQTIADLVHWERSENLAAFRVGGVPLWRLIRNDLFDRYLRIAGLRDRSNHNRPRIRNWLSFGMNVLRSAAHMLRLRRYEYLVIGFPRRRLIDGLWFDHFSDPLIEIMGEEKTACIEKPFIGTHGRPARTRNIIYYDLVIIVSAVVARFFFWVGYRWAGREIEELSRLVAPRLDVNRNAVKRMLCRKLVALRIELALFRHALSIIRPRLVLMTSRWVHLPIIFACKASSIPVWELQHGVPGEEGYKYGTEYDKRIDPDLMLTFGEHWRRLSWGGMETTSIIPIGYKWLCDRRLEIRVEDGQECRVVMLVSQPEMYTKLSSIFMELATSNPNINFLLKLHPQDISEWTERYPVTDLTNVSVHADPADDIYRLFKQCFAVVGYSSTVLFEAAFFGLRTGVLNFDGSNQCAALDYVGRSHFFELTSSNQLDAMFRADIGLESGMNPFFMDFDDAAFWRLVERTHVA